MIPINKIKVLLGAIKGYVYKWLVDLGLISIPEMKGNDCDIIVSLTSYGRRVADGVVYYTLVSLLRQIVQPARIILWLAEDEWNDEKLPKKLKQLRDKGVEIHYCEDIRSYKKLIPTILFFPNSNILTVDDDIIYSKDTVKKVWLEHKVNPNAVICLNASIPIIEKGVPTQYARWKDLKKKDSGMMIFPVGCGGTFYPAGSLHSDVIRKDLFIKLCPLADDIWFWFCGMLNKTEKNFLGKSGAALSFDALYQYLHKGSALTHTNRFEHANDKQFKELFEHYGVFVDSKGNLIKGNDNFIC